MIRNRQETEESTILLQSATPVTISGAIDNAKCGLGNIRLVLGPYFTMAYDGGEVIIITVLSLDLKCEWDLATFQVFLLGISSFLGMFFGTILCAPFSDKYGRKPVLICNFVGLLLFGLLSGACPGFVTFFICRFLLGVFIGASLGPAAAYLVEVVPTNMRVVALMGKVVSFGLGSLISVLFTMFILPVYGWRVLVIACAVVFVPGLVFLFFGEESPHFDFNNHREVAALDTISKLYKYNRAGTFDSSSLTTADREGEEHMEKETTTLMQLLHQGSNLRDICLFFVYSFGILFIFYAYSFSAPKLLNGNFCPAQNQLSSNLTYDLQDEAKCKKISSTTLKHLVITYTLSPIGPIIASVCLETIGRRNTSCLLALILLVFNSLLYTCISRAVFVGVLTITRAVSKALNMFMALLPCEYFPTNMRSFAASIAHFGGRCGTIASIFVALYGYNVSPLLVIGCIHLGILCVLVMTYLLKKETKDVPLDEEN